MGNQVKCLYFTSIVYVHLTFVLNLVERSLAWPEQFLVNIVQLMYSTSESDCPITLTQAPYRVWSGTRRWHVAEWSASHVQFWDEAVAGSSCSFLAGIRVA